MTLVQQTGKRLVFLVFLSQKWFYFEVKRLTNDHLNASYAGSTALLMVSGPSLGLLTSWQRQP